MKIRLSKLLAQAGVASRRAAEELIFSGKVRVNGEICLVPQTLVSFETDVIHACKKQVMQAEDKVYFLLHKPVGFLCTNLATNNKKLVKDLFADLPYRLFTVGRLDRGSSGLLIVTNDGAFANRVIHPSFGLTKEYLVKTEQEITHEHLVKIGEGADVEGRFVKPIKVTKVRKGTVKVVVREGRKHEVRLFMAAAGLTIKELVRIRIGSLHLGALAPGQYRPLSPLERDALLGQN